MMKSTRNLSLILTTMVSLSAVAAPPKADLMIAFQPASAVTVNTMGNYSLNVANIGNRDADGISVIIKPALTNTSPSVGILGTVGGMDGRCQRSGNQISCAIGTLRAGRSTVITFGLALPYSSRVLTMSAQGATSSQEASTLNNNASLVPNITYPAFAILSDKNVSNSHCTGRGLSSYFECLMFPSSLSSHATYFEAGGNILFEEPGYSGQWQQPGNDPRRLTFQYYDGSAMVASFDGYSVGSDCFEGMTTFPQSPTYVSPYRVCLTNP